MSVKPKARPEKLPGVTYEKVTGCGSIFITVTYDEKGMPFEVFPRLGKAGGCSTAQTEAIGRLASILLRCDVSPNEVITHLKGIQCDRARGIGAERVTSCADAVGKALEEFMSDEKLREEIRNMEEKKK